ncbi:MAG TPA: 3-hydroxyacyl-CoA dehydrogenase family protein, partial [Planctomycetes bacterium]|nr:3-hydroxyacyl-CoA dehydrogenase family protein [Planctomycetota bacterium]
MTATGYSSSLPMELRGVNVVSVLVSGSIMHLRPDLLQWRGTLVYPVRSGGSHLLWFEATAHRCGGEMPDHIGRKGESMAHRITVIGAGTMGLGIAQVTAIHGIQTVLCDLSPEQLTAACCQIEASVEKGIEKGKNPVEARDLLKSCLSTSTEVAEACQGSDFIIEAVPEVMQIKTKIFEEVEQVISEHAILATNTSSLPITKLSSGLTHPQRFVGMHFFNPVPIMALVEVVRGDQSSEATIDAAVELAKKLGKEPIVVKDSPGFATSRLGLVLGLEAIRMLEAGVASAQEIDKAMELGYRHPMGPLRLTDLVGLDVRLAIAEYLHSMIGEQFRPP